MIANLWQKYRVELTFITPVYGTIPGDPEVIKAWLKARMPRVAPPGARTIDEINEEVLVSLDRGEGEASEEFSILVFQHHEGVCAVRYDTIRAHIKDCARVLSRHAVGSIEGESAFSTRVINGVYLDPTQYWIPILDADGKPITKHDREVDKFVHSRTRTGQPINALKRLEVIEPGCRLVYTLKVLAPILTPEPKQKTRKKDGKTETVTVEPKKPTIVAEEDLNYIHEYGGTHGYGGERSADGGKYFFKITKL